MDKYIEKQYAIEEECVRLSFEDTRDNYVYDEALGNIGNIFLSNSGVFLYPTPGFDVMQSVPKEKILYQAIKEIFGTEEFNPLSSEYYQTIKTMIANGDLESFGYTPEEPIEYEKDIDLNLIKPRRH